jgi:D-amino-acid dehydrogenase
MAGSDVIVLGAGMVGVSTALHLQKRDRAVLLVDRRGAGEETSYGNTGIIQREGVMPYPFPRDVRLLWRYAFNRLPESHLHWRALPAIAPWLYRYWRASTPAAVAATSRGARPLIERCVIEHETLLGEAGALGLMRRTGYLRLYRSAPALDSAMASEKAAREEYDVNFEMLSA